MTNLISRATGNWLTATTWVAALVLSLSWLLVSVARTWAHAPDTGPPEGTTEEVEGVLEVYHEDYDDTGRYVYHVRKDDKLIELRVQGDPPGWRTGQHINAHGWKYNNQFVVEDADVSALLAPVLSGAQRTIVILVNFSDKVAGFTLASVRTTVFTTTSNFDLENSYGLTWLAGDAVGPFTISLSSTACDYQTLATQARSVASSAGVSLTGYTRFVYVFPKNACGWWGLGTVGGVPSHAWINDNPQLRVFAHELGHNFGLYHSHSMDCGASVIYPPCATSEYGDLLDVMGTSIGHVNAFQKERLGWLGSTVSPPILTVTSSGDYTVSAYETAGFTAKALKVLKATNATTGTRTWYYVELRQPIGFDSWLAGNANLTNGVVIHTGSESSANSSYLLDLTPWTTSWMDSALTVGQTFQDAVAGVTMTVTAVDRVSQRASVAIALVNVPVIPPPPPPEPPPVSCYPPTAKRCRGAR